jgi:thiamine-monophosphate kinase
MKLSDLGERALLDLIREWTASSKKEIVLGAGDDAAILAPPPGCEIVVSTDAYAEGVHFSSEYLKPDEIGHRVMAGTLSDLAAMGARGLAAFVNLHAPEDLSVEFLHEAYRGLRRVADPCGVAIAGGDTIRGSLCFDLTAVGTVVPGEAIRRSGARRGDQIFVSGELGRSEAGRLLLSGQVRLELSGAQRAVVESAHRTPIPRFDVAEFLTTLERRTVRLDENREDKERIRPTAMIDVSDGLALDLHRMCTASQTGCRLYASEIPVNAAARRIARHRREGEAALALGGGEDYELLFTLSKEHAPFVVERAKEKRVTLSRIGEMTDAEDGTVLVLENGTSEPLPAAGYDHFARREPARRDAPERVSRAGRQS